MKRPIRLGIAGTGRMAARMVRAIGLADGMSVHSIASGDPERARWFAGEIEAAEAFETTDAMANSDKVDAIYVAGRTRDHTSAAVAAIKAGKPVLVEKPLAVDLEKTKEVIETAHRQTSLLMENLWCLALPAYRAMHARLQSGSYGQPVHMRFDFGYPVRPESHPSLFSADDGGAILDRGVYGVSLAIQLLGPVEELNCIAKVGAEGVDLSAGLQMRHASGATSHVAVALNALMSNTASVACTHGVLGLGAPVVGSETLVATQMVPQAAEVAQLSLRNGLKDQIRSWSVARWLKRLRDQNTGRFFSHGADPYLPVLDHFRDLIRADRAESNLIPLSLSLETQKILHQARSQVAGN